MLTRRGFLGALTAIMAAPRALFARTIVTEIPSSQVRTRVSVERYWYVDAHAVRHDFTAIEGWQEEGRVI